MKILLILLLFSGCYTIRMKSGASPDGPYLLYRNGLIISKSVVSSGDTLEGKFDTVRSRGELKLRCQVNGRGEGFAIRLHDSLGIQPSRYEMPEKLFLISDIEGNYEAFTRILRGNGIIDRNNAWAFGAGHLALLGDFFDRGLNVTETLWLVYKLEREAEQAGGKVHFILGNHEFMNLAGNTKYVEDKYIENTQLLRERYSNLYDEYSELGRWLRTRNIAEKIGPLFLVHAGISPALARSGLSLERLNALAREHIGKKPGEISGSEARLVHDTQAGPFWYRGLVKQELKENEVTELLRYADCAKMIVGHTVVADISAFYGNRVIAIDLDHRENLEKGFVKGLLIEKGIYYRVDDKGKREKMM